MADSVEQWRWALARTRSMDVSDVFALAEQLTVPLRPNPERASFTGTDKAQVTPAQLLVLAPVHGLVPVQVDSATLLPATSRPNCARPAAACACGMHASRTTA